MQITRGSSESGALAGVNVDAQSGAAAIRYRPDIDGLRAVAVLSVVAFHYFPVWVTGGLVGVDVFFVISGFLISKIIIGGLAENKFSFIEFYTRRIRRIFPALLVVLAATMTFGWFALLSSEFSLLGKHAAAAAGFYLNFVLLNEVDYFDPIALLKPLLHLWSLSIEEQFYLGWPFLMWLTWRRKKDWVFPLIVGTCVISFTANIYLSVSGYTEAAFYLPIARFWELSLGSLIAYTTHRRSVAIITPFVANILSVLGVSLILVTVLALNAPKTFPGWWTLPPTVGAALIILSGSSSWMSRHVLSNGKLVWVGLISYPLYLWHWPILSFMAILQSQMPERNLRIAGLLASFVLAAATYWLVEKPLRFGSYSRTKTLMLIVGILAGGSYGYITFQARGWPAHERIQEVAYAGEVTNEDFFSYIDSHFYPCDLTEMASSGSKWRCHQSRPAEAPTIAIVGDSHAEHLFPGLAEAFPNTNFVYYVRSGIPRIGNKDFAVAFKKIIEAPEITTVILSAYWYQRLLQYPEIPLELLPDELEKTFSALTAAGKKVFITDDVPDFPFFAKACKFSRNLLEYKPRCLQPKNKWLQAAYNQYSPKLIAATNAWPNVTLLNTAKYFCDEDVCSMVREGQLLYRGNSHLSIRGSQFIAKQILKDTPQLSQLTISQ